MNLNMASEWLRASYSDIVVMDNIVDNEIVTHMTAFHAQQSVEKSFKAVLEYNGIAVPKKHDVRMLRKTVHAHLEIENTLMLDSLNTLYIDSRYPGSFGLLPHGKPTLEDAKEFYTFAQEIFDKVCILLDIPKEEIISDKSS